MIRNHKIGNSTGIALLLLLVMGCSTSKPQDKASMPGELASIIVKDVDLTDGKVLFSLKEGQIVSTDLEETGNWDVAFEFVSIIANHQGQLVVGKYEEVNTAPVSGYVIAEDNDGVDLKDPVAGSWYNYDSNTHIVTALPDRSYVIKTRDDKYAKLQVLDYYKQNEPGKDAPRYLTFRYTYQDDGSTNLASKTDSSIVFDALPTTIIQ